MNALEVPANKVAIKKEKQEDLTVDVVVVGSGGAGMSAAVKAAESGKSVVYLKMPIVGGNTNRATGGMNISWNGIPKGTRNYRYKRNLVC